MHLAGSYRPGPLPAAIGPRAVLIWRPPGGPTPSAAWQVVVEGAPVGQVLPLLASTGSWTQLPDFALVLVDPHGLRVLVRGALRVQLLCTDGDPVHVSGAQAVTWSETLVAGAVSATIASDDADQPEPGGLPVVAGVVNASALTWTPDLAQRANPSSTPATGITAPVPPPEPPAAESPSAAATAGQASSWAPTPMEPAPAPAPLESPLAAAGAAPLPAPAPGAATIVAAPEPVIEQTLPPSAYDRPDVVDLAPAGDAETSLSYDLLYGTRPHLGRLEPPALEPPDAAPPVTLQASPDASGAAVAPASLSPLSFGDDLVDHPAAGPAPLAPPEEPVAPAAWQAPPGPALITSSPWRLSSAPAPDGAAGLPVSPFAGPAEATVRRGSPAVGTVEGAPAEDDDGLVDAVRCPGGHLNAPQAGACRVCGADVPFQAPARLPKPALGVLHLHGGADDHGTGPRTVTVDRPLVLGRQPRASGLVGGELPALVTLPPPNDDISRSHVQVEIDGWRLLARDLGSANGTLLDAGTGTPRRLDPQQPVELVSGDRLVFSDDVSVTFEAR